MPSTWMPGMPNAGPFLWIHGSWSPNEGPAQRGRKGGVSACMPGRVRRACSAAATAAPRSSASRRCALRVIRTRAPQSITIQTAAAAPRLAARLTGGAQVLHADGPLVVLHHKDDWQLVEGCHVEGLVELAHVAGAVAEEVDADAVRGLVAQHLLQCRREERTSEEGVWEDMPGRTRMAGGMAGMPRRQRGRRAGGRAE